MLTVEDPALAFVFQAVPLPGRGREVGRAAPGARETGTSEGLVVAAASAS
jgi:hypothetical protein